MSYTDETKEFGGSDRLYKRFLRLIMTPTDRMIAYILEGSSEKIDSEWLDPASYPFGASVAYFDLSLYAAKMPANVLSLYIKRLKIRVEPEDLQFRWYEWVPVILDMQVKLNKLIYVFSSDVLQPNFVTVLRAGKALLARLETEGKESHRLLGIHFALSLFGYDTWDHDMSYPDFVESAVPYGPELGEKKLLVRPIHLLFAFTVGDRFAAASGTPKLAPITFEAPNTPKILRTAKHGFFHCQASLLVLVTKAAFDVEKTLTKDYDLRNAIISKEQAFMKCKGRRPTYGLLWKTPYTAEQIASFAPAGNYHYANEYENRHDYAEYEDVPELIAAGVAGVNRFHRESESVAEGGDL